MQVIEKRYERIHVGICKQLSEVGVILVGIRFQPRLLALTKVCANDSNGGPVLEPP